MARKIRFPLKMTNGTEVRTIEELRADFDLTAVLGYYADDKLVTWLRDRYLDNEADKIEALDKDSKSFQGDLCAALGVETPSGSDEADGELDMDYINRRNEKKRILRTITDDEEIIYKVDQVAFDQDDLFDIYDEGKKEIYLCQGEFEIPLSVTDVTYIGVADPIVTVRVTDNVNFKEKNIKFVDCVYGWDISNTTPLDEMRKAENLFLKGDYRKAMAILETHAELDNPRANVILHLIGRYYYTVFYPSKHVKALEDDFEISGIVVAHAYDENYKVGKNHFHLLKKLADKGDWLCEFYYAVLLRKKADLDIQQTVNEMVEYFKASAEKGNFSANLQLLYIYSQKRKGIFESDKTALNFISQYAESGEPLAQFELYRVYDLKYCGVEKDEEKALEWLTKAAENNLPKAQQELGSHYKFGLHGVERNIIKAIEWYTKSVEQGDLYGCDALGDLYYEINNYPEAMKWFSKYFEITGENDSCYRYKIGECYYYGKGVAQDKAKAIEWYTKAANNQDHDAYYRLAECHYYGDGVKKDYEQTFKWLSVDDFCWHSEDEVIKFVEVFEKIKEAAESGNADKQYELGFCYEYGIGTKKNYDMAIECFVNAAENGNAKALYRVGKDLEYNDIEDAIELLQQSAQKGHITAMEELGNLYEFGVYIEKNYEEALKWYTMAFDHGSDYKRKIDFLKSKMEEGEANS